MCSKPTSNCEWENERIFANLTKSPLFSFFFLFESLLNFETDNVFVGGSRQQSNATSPLGASTGRLASSPSRLLGGAFDSSHPPASALSHLKSVTLSLACPAHMWVCSQVFTPQTINANRRLLGRAGIFLESWRNLSKIGGRAVVENEEELKASSTDVWPPAATCLTSQMLLGWTWTLTITLKHDIRQLQTSSVTIRHL